MGFDALSWAWKQKTKAKLVLVALAESANDDTGECWPGLKLISKRCDMSIRSVQRAIKQMTEEKILRVTPRYREDGTQTSNTYHLCLPTIPEMTTYPDAHVGETLTPVSPLEPELEPSKKESPKVQDSHSEPLRLGEFGWVVLTSEQEGKLRERLGSLFDGFVERFDNWVNEAPNAKQGGVRRRDRHAYESIKAWHAKDGNGGRNGTYRRETPAEAAERYNEEQSRIVLSGLAKKAGSSVRSVGRGSTADGVS